MEPLPTEPATESAPEAGEIELSAPPSGAAAEGPTEEPTGFVATTFAELRKVVWPNRQQLVSESVAVILMVGLSAAAIAAVDRFYGWVSTQVFG